MNQPFCARNTNKLNNASFIDYTLCFLLTLALFCICFYYVDSAVEKLPKYKVAFGWEKNIPFLSLAFIPYYGILALPILIPFAISNKTRLYKLTFRLILSIIIAGIVFRIFPCELSYSKRNISPELEHITTLITGKFNLVPSLHVCLTHIICMSLFKEYDKIGKLIMVLTIVILPISTLFCHQHHIIDLISGLILGVLTIQIIK